MTEAEILTTIREESLEEDASGRKVSAQSLVLTKKPASPILSPKSPGRSSPKPRTSSPSYKRDPSRPRTSSIKDMMTMLPFGSGHSEHYAELRDERSSPKHQDGKATETFVLSADVPSAVEEEKEREREEKEEEKEEVKEEVKGIEEVQEEKRIDVADKEKKHTEVNNDVGEKPVIEIPQVKLEVPIQAETPSKDKHKPRLTYRTPPRVVPKTPRARPPPSPKLPKIPPSPVINGREDPKFRPRPRSRAASVIQKSVRKYANKRTRAFTNATVETKEALRISRTFQTIYDLRSHAAKWSDLKDMRQLSAGMFGEVHIAKHKGHLVVVKTLKPIRMKPDASERRHKKAQEEQMLAVEDFKKEMSLLTKLWHRNIVHLIGVGTQPQLFMIMEYMSGGSLKDILAECRQKKEAGPGEEGKLPEPLSRRAVYEYSMDCAQGMKYLHEAFPRILHRDLKPANLLITKPPDKGARPELKIADFGLSRVLGPVKTSSSERYRLTGGTGSLRYMAPEVAANQPYNEKADVYGFGIILWEMLANDLPYKKLHTHNFYKEVVKKKVRPPMDMTWPEEVISLITECWDDNPDKRPTFRKIIERLRGIKSTTTFFDDAPEEPPAVGCGGCSIV